MIAAGPKHDLDPCLGDPAPGMPIRGLGGPPPAEASAPSGALRPTPFRGLPCEGLPGSHASHRSHTHDIVPPVSPAPHNHHVGGLRALAARPSVHVIQRVLLAVVGGYLLTESATALLAWALAALGMARSEAVVLGMLLAFVLYLGLLVWAFAERRLARLWLVLGVGTLVAIGLAHVVQGAA